MALDHHIFTRAEIIDQNTVRGVVDGATVDIKVLHGGLPRGTEYVTIRDDKKAPDGNIIMGAHYEGRATPITIIGTLKTL